MAKRIDTDRRRELVSVRGVTLDGKPAAIGGVRQEFAGVARLDGQGGTVEFAWSTVEHVIVNCGGEFKS